LFVDIHSTINFFVFFLNFLSICVYKYLHILRYLIIGMSPKTAIPGPLKESKLAKSEKPKEKKEEMEVEVDEKKKKEEVDEKKKKEEVEVDEKKTKEEVEVDEMKEEVDEKKDELEMEQGKDEEEGGAVASSKKAQKSKTVKKVLLTPEERKNRMREAAQNRRMKNFRKKEEIRKDVGYRVATLKKICEDNAIPLVYDESNPKTAKYELERGQYKVLNNRFSKIFNGYMTTKHKKLAITLDRLSNLIKNMQNPEEDDPEFHRLIKKFAKFSLLISRSMTSIKNESGFGIMHRALVGSWPRRFTVKKVFKEEACSLVCSESSTPKDSEDEDEDEDEDAKSSTSAGSS